MGGRAPTELGTTLLGSVGLRPETLDLTPASCSLTPASPTPPKPPSVPATAWPPKPSHGGLAAQAPTTNRDHPHSALVSSATKFCGEPLVSHVGNR